MKHDSIPLGTQPPGFWSSRYAIGLLVLGAIATYFFLSDHRAHFIGELPFLLARLSTDACLHASRPWGTAVTHDAPAYGLWTLVILNSAVFVMFAFSFFKPQTARDWRTFSAFAAFVVALFVEMYGFPLTIYLLSGWLQTRFHGLDLLSHNAGHLWSTLLGEKGDPHFGVLHIASYVFLGFGFYLLSSAWNVLYHAQRRNSLATTGPYARIRHPQYVAFVLILLGFLLQWPTLPTLLMFPVLLVMYGRLAVNEEAQMRTVEFDAYAARTPRFLPTWTRQAAAT